MTKTLIDIIRRRRATYVSDWLTTYGFIELLQWDFDAGAEWVLEIHEVEIETKAKLDLPLQFVHYYGSTGGVRGAGLAGVNDLVPPPISTGFTDPPYGFNGVRGMVTADGGVSSGEFNLIKWDGRMRGGHEVLEFDPLTFASQDSGTFADRQTIVLLAGNLNVYPWEPLTISVSSTYDVEVFS